MGKIRKLKLDLRKAYLQGSTIGANSVVTKSFYTPGITIAGVPAKEIKRSVSE